MGGETAAGSRWRQRFLFLWPGPDCPHSRAHLVRLFLRLPRAASSPALGRLPYSAGTVTRSGGGGIFQAWRLVEPNGD